MKFYVIPEHIYKGAIEEMSGNMFHGGFLTNRAMGNPEPIEFDTEHEIEFRNDGWTVQHPISERLDGSLFDCDFANWDAGDIGYRGRYTLYMDEDGQLNIGDKL